MLLVLHKDPIRLRRSQRPPPPPFTHLTSCFPNHHHQPCQPPNRPHQPTLSLPLRSQKLMRCRNLPSKTSESPSSLPPHAALADPSHRTKMPISSAVSQLTVSRGAPSRKTMISLI